MDKLTKKEKTFADEFISTGNGVQSALKAYDTKDYNTAGVMAHENLRKPKIQAYIEDQAEGAMSRIVELSMTAKNEQVKLSANKDIVDRAGHKPVEKQEQSGEIIVKQIHYGDYNSSQVPAEGVSDTVSKSNAKPEVQ